MSLFLNEVKKIFSWKTVLFIVVINILLFKLLIEFDLKYFPNGRPFGDMFKIEQEIIPIYGIHIDEAEIQNFEQTYERLKAEANEYIANDPKAAELNIVNYEQFRTINSSEGEKYRDELFHERGVDFVWALQSYNSYLNNYQYRGVSMENSKLYYSPRAQDVIQQRLDEEKYSFYDDFVLRNFKTYATSVAITIFISITLLLATLFIGDKRAGVVPIQYTSKKGRKLFRTKWLAGLVSAGVVTALLTTLYIGLYTTNNTSSHFDLPLYAFSFTLHWYEMTFFQYIVIIVSLMVFLSMLLAILTMAVSNIVPNRIALIVSLVVVLFCMIAGVASVVLRRLFELQLPEFLMPITVTVLVLITVFLTWFTWKREMTKDIL
jgi:hypothetical protein